MKKAKNQKTIEDYVKEYFKSHPNREIPVSEATEDIKKKYLEETGEIVKDVGRVIRLLYELDFLEKPSRGVYLYDPKSVSVHKHKTSKSFSFKKETIEKCILISKARNDDNATKCFKKVLATLNKYGIDKLEV